MATDGHVTDKVKPGNGLRVEYWLFVLVLVFSPLAFGTVEPWSISIMETLIFLSALIFLARRIKRGRTVVAMPGAVPLILLLIYMVLQAIPLPPAAVKVLSPAAYEAYSSSVYLDDPARFMPLALYKRGLFMEFFRLSSYVAAYSLSLQFHYSRSRLKMTLRIISILVCLIAFASIVAKFSSASHILWIREAPFRMTFFGPFVNKNHYAGFAGMLLPFVIGWMFVSGRNVGGGSIAEKLMATLSARRFNPYFLWGMGAVIVAVSIFLSLSRSGIVGMCISVLLFIVMYRRFENKKALALLVIGGLVFTALWWFGFNPIVSRFGVVVGTGGIDFQGRSIIFSDTLRAVYDYFIQGSGFGSFSWVYPAYRSLEGRIMVDHVHNDYLELLLEGGVVSFALLGWFVYRVILSSVRALRHRRDKFVKIMAIAALSGICYMAFHSMLDFNLHIGSNGLYFFVILGIFEAASKGSRSRRARIALSRLGERGLKIIMGGVGVVLLASLVFNGSILLAERSFARYSRSLVSEGVPAYYDGAIGSLMLASTLDPLNSEYRYAMAMAQQASFDFDAARRSLMSALVVNPLCGHCLQAIAIIDDMAARPDSAARYFESSVKYGARKTDKYLRYASWLARSGQAGQAVEVFRQGIRLEPEMLGLYIRAMRYYGLSREQMRHALEPCMRSLYFLAMELMDNNKQADVPALLEDAMRIAHADTNATSREYAGVFRLYVRLNMDDEAMDVLLSGVARFPDSQVLRVLLAQWYERMGSNDKAIEHYLHALEADPFNKPAQRGIKRLKR